MNINKYTSAIMAPSNRPFLVISVMIVCYKLTSCVIVYDVVNKERIIG